MVSAVVQETRYLADLGHTVFANYQLVPVLFPIIKTIVEKVGLLYVPVIFRVPPTWCSMPDKINLDDITQYCVKHGLRYGQQRLSAY